MPKNSLISSLKAFLGLGKKTIRYSRFMDPLGDFEISYPSGWKFDKDIAVVGGRYSVQFESHEAHFTVSVDASIPPAFNFRKYVRDELEAPTSGILADVTKTSFRGMAAYKKEYSYNSGGKDFFGRDLMFRAGKVVFLISWNGPESRRTKLEHIFRHMLESLNTGVPGG